MQKPDWIVIFVLILPGILLIMSKLTQNERPYLGKFAVAPLAGSVD